MDIQSRDRLLDEIKVIQRRLGTDDEQPHDLERVRSMVHDFNNALTTVQAKKLVEDFRRGSIPAVVLGGGVS